jgi:hypothetical protein
MLQSMKANVIHALAYVSYYQYQSMQASKQARRSAWCPGKRERERGAVMKRAKRAT